MKTEHKQEIYSVLISKAKQLLEALNRNLDSENFGKVITISPERIKKLVSELETLIMRVYSMSWDDEIGTSIIKDQDMEDEDLMIDVDEYDLDHSKNISGILLCLLIDKFKGCAIDIKTLQVIIGKASGVYIDPNDVKKCISKAMLVADDEDLCEKIGFYIEK